MRYPMNDSNKKSIHYLGEGTEIEGKLTVDNTVIINATISGSVEGHQEVVFETKGRMKGPIRAQTVTVKGKIQGDIVCRGIVKILPGGELKGKVTTPPGNVVVREGGILNCRLSPRQSGSESLNQFFRQLSDDKSAK